MQAMEVSASLLKPKLHVPRLGHPMQTPQTLPKRSLSTAPSPLKPKPAPLITTTPLFTKSQQKYTSQTTPISPKFTDHALLEEGPSGGIPSWVILGAASLGLALLLVGADGQEALALGPEGPLVEEFWDNVRRYMLYFLTVSTGVVYTVLQPIIELLKNPISAILIITVLLGSGYIVSQVLSAMVGITDFSYNYSY